MVKVLAEIIARDGDKNELQDKFRNGIFKSGSDPRDHIKKLQEQQEKFERRHQIIKTDDDTMHQMFEVLGSKCKRAVESLKNDTLMNENVTLKKCQEQGTMR